MRNFGLALICWLTLSMVQSKHFLVETEDGSAERFRSDDYADDNTLTETELKAVMDALPVKGKELYNKANITEQQRIQKKIRSAYGHDLDKMVESAKNGNMAKLFNGGKECLLSVFCFSVCFSGSSEVQTPNGAVPMKDLRLNDLVLTYTPGTGNHYTEFLGWLDRSASKPAVFLNVSTSSSSITLSASHVIFRASKSGSIEPVYAGELQEGDKLVKSASSDKLMEEEEIVSIEMKRETSYWAPLTEEGTLLVDGFLASSYASYPHEVGQLLLAPVKMFPRLLLDDETSQHEDGVRKSVKMLKEVADRMGLRRKVAEEANLVNEGFLPNSVGAAIAASFSKNIEL